MKTIRAVLKDRRRSQRGGVLSGVLIMLAFIAILSGALMTELSTNFLLSNNLMNRSMNQATVNSATELALDLLETSPISAGCPSLASAQLNLNGRSAVPSYASCWPAYREQVYSPIASSSSFSIDGSHAVLPAASPAQDLYVLGDAAGNVYQFPFGDTNFNWVYTVPGSVTGPPVTVQDVYPGQNAKDLMTLVPLLPGGSPPAGCAPVGCVAMLAEDTDLTPRTPDRFCYMAASDRVTSSAAMGVNFPTVAFFGDRKGALFAYSASEKTVPCPENAGSTANNQAVIAGPFVFPGSSGGNAADEVFVVTSTSVVRFVYTQKSGEAPQLQLASTLTLPWSGVVGAALEKGTLPARLAISFSNGHLATIQLQNNFGMVVAATQAVPSTIQGAPYWCHCPGGDQIAVGGTNGALYLFDPGLNQIASLAAGGTPVLTGLATDSVGEWFFGDTSGYVHEIQRLAGQSTMAEVARFYLGSPAGAISSTLQVAPCSGEICIYLGTLNGNAYRVPLDSRQVEISACISQTLPTCSGVNPHLWTRMEIGREGNPNEVHVQGWSYYST